MFNTVKSWLEKVLFWNPHCFTWFGVPTYIHSTTFFFNLILLFQGLRAFELGIFVIISVIIHEYGHILAARQFGVGCKRVLVLPIGGLAMLERMPREWKQELWIAAAGPLTSFALALIAFPLAILMVPLGLVKIPLDFCLVNLVLFLFNILPIFPMDGGRMYRALMHTAMSYKDATWYAVRTGQVLGATVAILLLLSGSFIGCLTLGFVAMLGETELKNVNKA